MFICCECGKKFDDNEIKTWVEDYGERMSGCPKCFGAYEEAKQCKICGEYVLSNELHNGYCEDCLLDYGRNYEILEKVTEEATEAIELPALIKCVLSTEKIKTILYRYIEDNDIDCTEFIKDDFDWFADRLLEVSGDD